MSKTKVDPYKKYIPLADKLTYTAAMIEAFICDASSLPDIP